MLTRLELSEGAPWSEIWNALGRQVDVQVEESPERDVFVEFWAVTPVWREVGALCTDWPRITIRRGRPRVN